MSNPEDVVSGAEDSGSTTESTANVQQQMGSVMEALNLDQEQVQQMVVSGIQKVGAKNVALFGGVALILVSSFIPNNK